MKLSLELSKRDTGRTLYILDEPTTGLHFHDIELLLNVLHRLRDHGNTVVVIEHNLDVIKTADWVDRPRPRGRRRRRAHHRRRARRRTCAATPASFTGQFLKAAPRGAAAQACRGRVTPSHADRPDRRGPQLAAAAARHDRADRRSTASSSCSTRADDAERVRKALDAYFASSLPAIELPCTPPTCARRSRRARGPRQGRSGLGHANASRASGRRGVPRPGDDCATRPSSRQLRSGRLLEAKDPRYATWRR